MLASRSAMASVINKKAPAKKARSTTLCSLSIGSPSIGLGTRHDDDAVCDRLAIGVQSHHHERLVGPLEHEPQQVLLGADAHQPAVVPGDRILELGLDNLKLAHVPVLDLPAPDQSSACEHAHRGNPGSLLHRSSVPPLAILCLTAGIRL